ncbi:MAG: AmmeMemoRadiSam system protein A [Anaerolineae bacterium]|nr:AmmeMemoRadiSam system protein A [Anaerolineae bacterium]
MHSFVALAYQAIETFLKTGQTISPPDPLPEEMAVPGAVFVSLHTADGMLRGCRGTITPTEPNLAEAIIHTAIASATDDPRFPPMTAAEIEGLDVKVDVLSELEPVSDTSELDEKVYGVLVQSGYRRALLLPDIAAVDSVPRQLELVRRKAGIGPDEPVELYRFTVSRYTRDD